MTDKVVVIGGGGFIGSRLTKLLLDAGNSVIVTSRFAGHRTGGHPSLEYRSVDVADTEGMARVIDGASVVYDLSMGGGITWEEHKRVVVDSAENIGKACLKFGVRRLIYTSSTAALYLAGNGVITEDAGPDPKPEERSFYSRGKIEAEKALLRLHASEQLPVVIMRPAVVLGPGGMLVHGAFGELPPSSDISILGFGMGKTPLPCVLVDDVAQALMLAKDAPAIDGMTFNLAGDVRPSASEYVEWIRQATHRNFRFYGRPVWWLKAGEAGRYALKVLGRKRNAKMGSLRDLASATMAAQLDCSRAKKLLGWKPESDPETFKRKALMVHIQPLPQGDLRLQRRG